MRRRRKAVEVGRGGDENIKDKDGSDSTKININNELHVGRKVK